MERNPTYAPRVGGNPVSKVRCNSCLATWEKPKEGQPVLPHVCPTTVIDQHSEHDPATGELTKKATYKTIENPRNENFRPLPDKPGEFVLVSEGAGVTEIE